MSPNTDLKCWSKGISIPETKGRGKDSSSRCCVCLTDVQEIIEAVQLLGRKYSTDAPAVDQEIRKDIDRLCCIEITIEHLSGKTAIEWVDPK